MIEALRTGKQAIGVIANATAKQRHIIEALQILQIPRVRAYNSFADLNVALLKQEVQWVLCSYYDEQGEGLLAHLPYMTVPQSQVLVHCCVLLKASEKQFVPSLFNSGLLSFQEISDSPAKIAEDFAKLLAQFEGGKEPSLVAFDTLREFLKAEARWREIAYAAERLLKLFPYDDTLRLQHIEALAKQGEKGRAKALLSEFELFDPKVSSIVAHLRESLLEQNDSHHKLLAMQYKMQSALVVDPNPQSALIIDSKLRELGFRDIHLLADGEEAAALIKRTPIDFAILEWQCPGLGAPFLLQRIRSEGFIDIPIVVLTDALDRSDTQLVKDMGVSQILRRPLNVQQLVIAMAWSITQAKAPTEAISYERHILSNLSKGDLDLAKQTFAKFQKLTARDPIKDKFLKACILYHERRFEEAKVLLIEATHASRGDNVNLAAWLSKCLIQLGEVKAAISLLKRVTNFSPKNIERLCALSEAAVQDFDIQFAEESLVSAQKLDSDAQQVHETKVKVAVASGETKIAVDAMKMLARTDGVVTYLNNLAVGMVKSGDMKEGIRLYKNCIKLLASEDKSLQAVLAYNLGLALIKNQEMQLGSVYLKQACDQGISPVYSRADSLYKRVIDAQKQGEVLHLQEAAFAKKDVNGEKALEEVALFQDLDLLRSKTGYLRGMLDSTTLISRLPRAS